MAKLVIKLLRQSKEVVTAEGRIEVPIDNKLLSEIFEMEQQINEKGRFRVHISVEADK